MIGDLSEFFANFCINSFPRTFADTQQSLTSQSRFASNTSSSSISHTRETAFFLNIRGQVDTYIFASVFFPLIQILTKTAEIIQKRVDVKRGLNRYLDLRLKSDSKIVKKVYFCWFTIIFKIIDIDIEISFEHIDFYAKLSLSLDTPR